MLKKAKVKKGELKVKRMTAQERAEKLMADAAVAFQRIERFNALQPPLEMMRSLRVLFIGAGAIGSHAAALLARMGIENFEVWDDDRVEIENIGVQAYTMEALGKKKTVAFEAMLKGINEKVKVKRHSERFDKRTKLPQEADVIIASVDNIPTRAIVWAKVKRLPKKNKIRLYVDPRMGPHVVELWATGADSPGHEFKANQRKLYESSFHADVPPAPCGMHSTPHGGAMAGAMVANTVRKWLKDEPTISRVVIDLNTLSNMQGGIADGDAGLRSTD